MKTLTIVLVCIIPAFARILDTCTIARELKAHGFPQDQISNWVCLVQGESSGNTAAENHNNVDGSVDYGLFQINSRYWCSEQGVGNGCNINCRALTDDNIADDSQCALHIFRTGGGFSAWVAWRNRCQGQGLPDITRC